MISGWKNTTLAVILGLLLAAISMSYTAPTAYGEEITREATESVSRSAQASEGFDYSALLGELRSGAFWLTLVVTLLAGAAGGLVYELTMLQGSVEMPHRPTNRELPAQYDYAIAKHVFDLGILARVIVGTLAGLAVLLVFAPSDTLRLLAMAVVAGSASTAFFRSIQDRLLATVALANLGQLESKASVLNEKVVQAQKQLAAAKEKARQPSSTPGSVIPNGAAPDTVLNANDLAPTEQLLEEARGVHETIEGLR